MDTNLAIELWIQAVGIAIFAPLLRARFRPDAPRVPRIVTAILVVCVVWFSLGSVLAVHALVVGGATRLTVAARLFLVFLFPPMIMQLVLAEQRERFPWRLWSRAYELACAACWVLSLAGGVFTVGSILGFLEWVPRRDLSYAVTASTGGLFLLCGAYSLLVLRRTRVPHARPKGVWRANVVLFGLLIGLSLVMISGSPFPRIVNMIGGAMPLLFIFVGTWQENRFEFVDQLVKRVVAVTVSVGALVAYFTWVWPHIDRLDPEVGTAWVRAFAVLPLFALVPWTVRTLNRQIEISWFGRRSTTVEAVKGFLAAVGPATREDELSQHAEQELGRIFAAPVRVDLRPREAPGFEVVHRVPVPCDDGEEGAFLLGPRRHQLPYFRTDAELLSSLADVFASMLENIRLQQRKRELSLSASRSELKALRAQINPHFLFNALNSIAGLIPQDPQRADRTIEQLAEVFRYTLRGSNNDWTRLEEELDFVTSYLDVERARFGERLRVSVDVEPRVRHLRVPPMMLQTLVENAIKHGVAAVRGPAAVRLEARIADDRLRLVVENTGPPPARNGRPADPAGEGYGLVNIRRRLAGQFGDDARLELFRDEVRERTVAAIVLPQWTEDRP